MSFINTILKELEKIPREESDRKIGVQPSLFDSTNNRGKFKSPLSMMISSFILLIAGTMIFTFCVYMMKHRTLKWNQHQSSEKIIQPAIQTASTNTVDASSTNIKTQSVLNETEIAEDYYQKAVIEMKNDDTSRAMADLGEAIKKNPQFQQAREALVVLLIQAKKMTAALETVDDGLTLTPSNLPFIKLKAHILVSLEKYKDALDLLSENAPSIDQDPNYFALMAAIYEKDKSYMVAARLYHQLTQINPEVGEWWFGLGASLQMAGKKNAAIEAYQKALEARNLKPEIRSYIETQIQENA